MARGGLQNQGSRRSHQDGFWGRGGRRAGTTQLTTSCSRKDVPVNALIRFVAETLIQHPKITSWQDSRHSLPVGIQFKDNDKHVVLRGPGKLPAL
jgi:hypothetical protein